MDDVRCVVTRSNGWLSTTFSAFSQPEYRVLWIGSLFAWLGFMMSQTAQSIVAFDLAETNRAVGLVALGNGTAMLLVAPFGGVIADRLSKRHLLLAGQAAIGVTFALVGVLILVDAITILLLVLLIALMGLAISFVGPARHAYVGEVVPQSQLANAVAMNQGTVTLARVIGPFAAGALISIGLIGSGGTFLFMAGLLAITVATLWKLPPSPGRPPSERKSVRRELVEGISYVRGNPRLRLLLLSFIALLMLGAPFQTVLPGLLENELDRPAEDLGIMLGVAAAGGVVVAVGLAGIVSGRFARPALAVLGVTLGVSLMLLAIAPTFWIAVAVMIPLGAGMTGYQLVNSAMLMLETDPQYYGRVMSLNMIAFAAMMLMNFPAGVIADQVGERPLLFATGIVTILIIMASSAGWAALGRGARREVSGEAETDASPLLDESSGSGT